jgi:hypothetical protein
MQPAVSLPPAIECTFHVITSCHIITGFGMLQQVCMKRVFHSHPGQARASPSTVQLSPKWVRAPATAAATCPQQQLAFLGSRPMHWLAAA